jgi:hypothetical protein
MSDKPKVVCLCGSEKFAINFGVANIKETEAGNIVLSPVFESRKAGEVPNYTPEQRARIDELQLRRIDMATEVLVMNIGGYIGESTKKEIAYARKAGKVIRWKEPHIRVDCLWTGDKVDGEKK